MPPKRRDRKSQAGVEDETFSRKAFDIPYFAHQVLDPEKFPYGMCNSSSRVL